MKKNVIITFIISCLSLIGFAFFLINQSSLNKTKIYSVKENSTRKEQFSTNEYAEKITIGAIGDILIHDRVYVDAYHKGSYNFNPMLQNVKVLLEKPDILTANQESVLGGKELGLSSYPTFNSPHEVANAIVYAGVDIVSTANNHALDKGEKGIDSESDYLDKIGLPHVGSFKSANDQHHLRIINKNGIKLAFLSYTYGTNGISLPLGKDFLVNYIDRASMENEIHRARESADVVIMSLHWGTEYQRIPTIDQKELAKFLANEGVDIIFGSHPHVLQPMEMIQTNDGRKTFVVYSLGNFLSGQNHDYKDIGGLATIVVTKHITDKGNLIELSNPSFFPTFVSSNNNKNYRVVPLKKAGQFGLANPDQIDKEIHNHMTQWIRNDK